MRCPACGHENNDLATRCSACGSMLQGTGFWSKQANSDADDAPRPAAQKTPTDDSQEDTAKRPFVPTPDEQAATAPLEERAVAQGEPLSEDTAERPQVPPPLAPQLKRDPQLRDVTGAAGRLVTSKRKRLAESLGKHQRALGVGIALLVVAIMGVVWLVTTLTNTPGHAQISADISERIPTYSYVGGIFGPDLEIPISHTAVTSCTATQTPEGMEVSDGVGSAAYGVNVEVTYEDGRIRVVRNVSTTYVRSDEGWTIGGELADQGTTFTALAGVDESKVLTNMGPILTSAGGELSQIYAIGEFNIVGNSFEESPEMDTAIDDVVIHCVSNGDFYSYEGNVTAHFAFESGEWRLRSAEADQSMGTRSYAPLLGTWSGTMVSHTADDGSCFGARNQAFVLTIDSLGETINDQARVQGTISALAHFHGALTSDKKTSKGDEYLESVAYSGAIIVDQHFDGSTLKLEGGVSASSSGEVNFEVEFGTDDDPSAAVAHVTTTYESEESLLLLISRKTTTHFKDTYLLTRVDAQAAEQ